MSDEYEYEDDERKPRRFTLGQILLGLLLLGVVVVIGLIVLVYLTLTDQKKMPSNLAPVPVSAPARPVERFTPTGEPATQNVQANAHASNPVAASEAKAADEAVNRLGGNRNAEPINQGAIIGGATAGAAAANATPRRQPKRYRRVDEDGVATTMPTTPRRRTQQNASEGEEIPLQPIQRGERRLTPRNTNTQQGERTLTPTRRAQNLAPEDVPSRRAPARANPPVEQRERPLTPTRPQSGKSEAIEQLF